jgi:hypothetical protein
VGPHPSVQPWLRARAVRPRGAARAVPRGLLLLVPYRECRCRARAPHTQ